MDKPTPAFTAEIDVTREFYAALNRNDIPAAVKAFDPEIEWFEPYEHPEGRTYRGIADVTAHFSQARAKWAEGSCEPERFVVAGDKVVVFVYVRVRLQHNVEWNEGRLGDVFTFRNGKVIHFRSFPDQQQALEWAGATDSKR